MNGAPTPSSEQWETLAALSAGELSDAEAREWLRRAEGDPELARRIELARRTTAAMRAIATEPALWDVTAAQKSRLLGLNPVRPRSTLAALVDQVREVFAALVLDSRCGGQVMPGFRGAGRGRHLLYRSERLEVELRFDAAAGGLVSMTGQVHAAAPVRELRLVAAEGGAERVLPVDEAGLFDGQVASGVYELSLALADERVVIPSLDVSVEP
ncbi:MAG: hypothetical protein HRU75_01085 [Planctomycetia bacterium]|nr:MAG: hypothetical protein HRU75_01085 [Planctomycetia bacterium]